MPTSAPKPRPKYFIARRRHDDPPDQYFVGHERVTWEQGQRVIEELSKAYLDWVFFLVPA